MHDDDESAAESARLKIELAKRTEAEDIKWMMSSPRGRRIVWRLLDACGVNRTSFNVSASAMAFSEGRRDIGLQLLAKVQEHCIDRYVEMLSEHKTK